jgi:hypothetical protein
MRDVRVRTGHLAANLRRGRRRPLRAAPEQAPMVWGGETLWSGVAEDSTVHGQAPNCQTNGGDGTATSGSRNPDNRGRHPVAAACWGSSRVIIGENRYVTRPVSGKWGRVGGRRGSGVGARGRGGQGGTQLWISGMGLASRGLICRIPTSNIRAATPVPLPLRS